MSTEIKSAAGRVRLRGDDRYVGVETTDVHDSYGITRAVRIPDFLAAVEAECDVIIVRRADLPEVKPGGQDYYYADGNLHEIEPGDAAEQIRATALGWLAIAEYLKAHPPVDEAQVEALTSAIDKARIKAQRADIDAQVGDIARTLVADGWAKS